MHVIRLMQLIFLQQSARTAVYCPLLVQRVCADFLILSCLPVRPFIALSWRNEYFVRSLTPGIAQSAISWSIVHRLTTMSLCYAVWRWSFPYVILLLTLSRGNSQIFRRAFLVANMHLSIGGRCAFEFRQMPMAFYLWSSQMHVGKIHLHIDRMLIAPWPPRRRKCMIPKKCENEYAAGHGVSS